MFAEGDAVNLDIPIGEDIISRTSNLSQLNPQTTSTTRIIQQEGQFFAVKQNRNGDFISSEPIDINLSPTGDPKEAYQRQEQNKMFGSIRNFGTALSLAPTLQTKVGGKIIGGIGNLLNKAFKYSPVKGTKIKGPARTSTGQFRSQSKFDPRSYKYEVQTGPATVIGGAGIAGGAYSATTGYDDVEEEKLEIAEELSALENEPKNQKEIDVETQQDDVNFEIVSTEGETPEGATVVDEEEETSKEAPQVRQQRLLDNPNFSRLIQNIGIGMIETGDIGGGIAQGSAQTVKDQIAAEEEERLLSLEAKYTASDFTEFMTKEQIKNTSGSKIAEQTNQLAESITNIEEGELSLQMFESVKDIMEKSDITGIGPYAGALFNQALSFLPGGSSRDLTPRQRAIVILEQIANGNIKTITGESGRTISNVDRQIAQKLVGSLQNPLTSETEALERIEQQITSVNQRTQKAYNQYKARTLYFTENGLRIPLAPKKYGIDVATGSVADEEVVTIKMMP